MAGDMITDGPLLVAFPIALLAGLVSFLSPCVLPLVPGYLSYVAGLTGAGLAVGSAEGGVVVAAGGLTMPVPARAPTRRVLAGSLLFVGGFSLVFLSFGAVFGGLGQVLREHQLAITRILGGLTIVLGLWFMGAFDRFATANRELRLHRMPGAGLAGAMLLAAVLGMALTTGSSATRGATLMLAYCIGLGLPFILVGLAMGRAAAALGIVRRHYREVRLIGGGMLVLIGILELTGAWGSLMEWFLAATSGWTVPV